MYLCERPLQLASLVQFLKVSVLGLVYFLMKDCAIFFPQFYFGPSFLTLRRDMLTPEMVETRSLKSGQAVSLGL
jgi:hypothetical protein